MLSPATCVRLQIALVCRYLVMFRSHFLDSHLSDFQKVRSVGKGNSNAHIAHVIDVFDVAEITKTTVRWQLQNLPQHSHRQSYISTGNDVTIYFRSAANCTNMYILRSRFGHNFLITVQSISKRFSSAVAHLVRLSH